jgi:hypothetical protein
MDRRTFLLGMAATPFALTLPEDAEAATWVRLGTRRVNGLIDVDRIQVGAGAGTFRRIRVRVRGNALLLYNLRVRYGNGADDQIPVRVLIPQGGYTRAIDLAGNDRFIRWVQFAYGKLPNGAGPTWVDLYGRR